MSFNLAKYNTRQILRIKDKKYAEKEVTVIYNRKDKKVLNVHDVQGIYDHVVAGLKKKNILRDSRILVTIVMGTSMFRTIKAFDGPLLIDDYIDYFDSHVKDTSKFEDVAQVMITVCQK